MDVTGPHQEILDKAAPLRLSARALSLRETKLVIFGSPLAGTPAMVVSPLAAIDLPLKVLIWEDEHGSVWMSYLTPQWLAERHALDLHLAAPFSAVEKLTKEVAK